MADNSKITLSARVHPRARRLAEAAAELQGLTLSCFAANAIEEAARRELMGNSVDSPHQESAKAPQMEQP